MKKPPRRKKSAPAWACRLQDGVEGNRVTHAQRIAHLAQPDRRSRDRLRDRSAGIAGFGVLGLFPPV